MKNKSFATLGLMALLAAASAFGQQRLKADIPFEFRLGDTVMPAGQYDVGMPYSGKQDILSFVCFDCRATAIAITHKVDGGQAPTKTKLVFNHYGDTYFLSAVWSAGSGSGSGLPKSKTEREIARNASLVRTSEVVLARR